MMKMKVFIKFTLISVILLMFLYVFEGVQAICPFDSCPPKDAIAWGCENKLLDYRYNRDPDYDETSNQCKLIDSRGICNQTVECQGMGTTNWYCRDWDPWTGWIPSTPAQAAVECHYGERKYFNMYGWDYQSNFDRIYEPNYHGSTSPIDYYPDPADEIADGCQDGHDNDCNGLCDATGCCEAQAVNCSLCQTRDCSLVNNEIYLHKAFCESNGGTWTPNDKASCESMTRNFCSFNDYYTYPSSSCPEWYFVHGTPYCIDPSMGFDEELCTLWGGTWMSIPYEWLEPDPTCAAAIPSGKKLIFRNGDGSGSPSNIAVIGSNGAVSIYGSVIEGWTGSPAPSGQDFVVRTSSGQNVAMLQRSYGRLYLNGTMYQYMVALPSAGSSGDDLIIRNSTGETVAYFDNSGNFYATGLINEGVPEP